MPKTQFVYKQSLNHENKVQDNGHIIGGNLDFTGFNFIFCHVRTFIADFTVCDWFIVEGRIWTYSYLYIFTSFGLWWIIVII